MNGVSIPAPRVPKPALWAGRIISILMAAFLVLDGVMKLIKPAPVMQATVRIGFPEASLTLIGVVLLVCTVLYLVPRTAVIGAILLTGYLGGAVAIQVRAGSSPFETLFPTFIGAFLWAGICLQDGRLLELLPWRRGVSSK